MDVANPPRSFHRNKAMAEQAAEDTKPGMGNLIQTAIYAVGIFAIVTASNVLTNVIMPPKVTTLAEQTAAADPQESDKPPIYHSLNPPLIANIDSDSSDFLQVSIDIMARDQEVIDAVESHAAAIRNNLLLMFAAQTDDDVTSRDAKEMLRGKVLAEVRSVLEPYVGTPNVEAVYFTSFVAQ
jgi:flagellar FliL protein